MTEPVSILVAKAAVGPIITTAHKTAKEAVEKANDARLTDLERTLANLKAADAAIWGLGREWEDLLRTAASCPLADTKKVQQLVDRIEGYLTTNLLRSELRLALEGLKEEHEVIEGRAKTIKQFPWKRKDRAKALQRYTETSRKLVKFLVSLGPFLLPMSPSGIGWGYLKGIQGVLANRMLNLEEAKRQVDELVQAARNDPRVHNWHELRTEIRTTHRKLLRAFK
jgi:hypothetical protein